VYGELVCENMRVRARSGKSSKSKGAASQANASPSGAAHTHTPNHDHTPTASSPSRQPLAPRPARVPSVLHPGARPSLALLLPTPYPIPVVTGTIGSRIHRRGPRLRLRSSCQCSGLPLSLSNSESANAECPSSVRPRVAVPIPVPMSDPRRGSRDRVRAHPREGERSDAGGAGGPEGRPRMTVGSRVVYRRVGVSTGAVVVERFSHQRRVGVPMAAVHLARPRPRAAHAHKVGGVASIPPGITGVRTASPRAMP
jgi:hypothetical protein